MTMIGLLLFGGGCALLGQLLYLFIPDIIRSIRRRLK